jgi:HAD superfamily hydrolase (TIGR01509 family)
MLKLVIFDLDGTLVDTDLLIVESWRKAYARFRPGYIPSLTEMVYFSGPALKDSAEKEFPDVDPQKVIAYFSRVSKAYYPSLTRAFPGAKELALELRKRGIKTAVNTNKISSLARYSLSCVGLDGCFDYLLAGGDVPAMKPAPDGVYKAMELAGVTSKDEVLYVGDTVFDLETAQNAGVRCVLVTWGVRKISSAAKARYYLDSFQDFFKVVSA